MSADVREPGGTAVGGGPGRGPAGGRSPSRQRPRRGNGLHGRGRGGSADDCSRRCRRRPGPHGAASGTRHLREDFHAARWQEPVIMEMGTPGERGVIPPPLEDGIRAVVGDPAALIPPELARATPPRLPELSQPQVLRHFMRLSQMTMGTDLNIDLGLGTCTMKYSPKVNEFLARSPKMADLHPWQARRDGAGHPRDRLPLRPHVLRDLRA